MDITSILKTAVERDASDVFLSVGAQPRLRINGQLLVLDPLKYGPTTAEDLQRAVGQVLTPDQRQRFERREPMISKVVVRNLGRFRIVAYWQRFTPCLGFRVIPQKVPDVAELGLPDLVTQAVLDAKSGLFIVAGTAGSGRSQTIAAILRRLNASRDAHILTIDDAIEHALSNEKAIVTQIDLLDDVAPPDRFEKALAMANAVDADVVSIDGVDDPERLEGAIELAEAGRLVLTTLRAPTSVHAIHKIAGVRDGNRRRVAGVLLGILTQRLVPSARNTRRVLCCEYILMSSEMRKRVTRDELESTLASAPSGTVQVLEHALAKLCTSGKISRDIAFRNARERSELGKYLTSESPSRRFDRNQILEGPPPSEG